MKKSFLIIEIIFISFLTSCLSQKYVDKNSDVEETFEIKKSDDLFNDYKKYGIPNNVLESTEKGYYVKTCTWNDVDGQEISCDYSIIEMRTCTRTKPNGIKKDIKKQRSIISTATKKTDYEVDIMRFGKPNDISVYRSDEYYSKTCTWYNACGKYRSYDYDLFGKRISTFESNPF